MFKNLIVSLCCLYTLNFLSAQTDHSSYRSGELIVMLKPGKTIASFLAKNTIAGKLSLLHNVTPRSNVYLLGFNETLQNGDELLRELKVDSDVAIAQFNHFIHTRALPDDVQFGTQYALNNTGQAGGVPDADIDAAEAWDITTGGLTVTGDTIVVAVIDDGFQLTHPDLDFWINRNETASNGIDDDGNGFIDDVKGWNVFSHNGTIGNAQHGTHVAGIIGARGNNAMGVSGVNWHVKLMPVVGATEVESEAIEAYGYVMECRRLYNETNGAKGAFVVATNSSFGVDMGQPSNFPIWCAFYDSLGRVGILSAAATANSNWNIDVVGDIPCSCSSEYLITVSCTGRLDTKVQSAGYGINTIDLGAPGHQVLSTYPSNTYNILTGTSMASPHVAGSVALMYAAACDSFMQSYKLYPDSMALQMKDFVLTATDPKPGFDSLFVTGGRLNVFNAINALQQYYECSSIGVKDHTFSDQWHVFPNPVSDKLSIVLPGQDHIQVRISDVAGRIVKNEIVNTTNGATPYQVDLSTVENGVYLVQLTIEGRQVHTEKLLICH